MLLDRLRYGKRGGYSYVVIAASTLGERKRAYGISKQDTVEQDTLIHA